MQSIPRRLKLLEKKLGSLPLDSEPMLVNELDGFVAGVLVCPDLIMPSEWLPMVWGGDEDTAPIFKSAQQAEQRAGLVMEHYNATANALHSGNYTPVFEIDTRHNEVLWELWIDGFETAMSLRPDSWATLLQSGEETRVALAGLITLTKINHGDSGLPEGDIRGLTEKAPDLVPVWVETLNTWRIGQHLASHPATLAPSFRKVGRNDPCPCGSGKKYKKCCGLN